MVRLGRLQPGGVLPLLPLLLLFAGGLLLPPASGYKPVVIVHGLFDSPSDFKHMLSFINQTHPGTNVTVIDLYDHTLSLLPMWKQVEGFRNAIYPIMQNAAEGLHLMCYSQGGLICRALLSMIPDHNVDTFISLSSPQLGQYGDPHHQDLYQNTSDFLALLNSERFNPSAAEWRKNFLRLRNLVLIGGRDDGVITPWQSSHFGFYNANETVVEMKKQMVYLRDAFGLKSLDARGAITTYAVDGVQHTNWHSNQTVFEACIAKWLT
ncbi:lysosomal thioesterase PPT2-A isoform X2 [Latimeria chalumnae]|uniref:lysosomal thioesterase PPT2-A isoform X2 n=1 Tax=Latimeria chalumnae TaxID=7897 RepID=UPI0003C11324|nr:PREDICTED: lysosomal thioesterase PPT2 isoform X2 [Latimeria chalumnae]|eukprot:XP_006007242.1 PREDICTED: lysosomal thioesterase PPT2 isoform X2 [Latimeria chalumnae]